MAKNRSVLIVEEDQVVRRRLRKALEGAGYEVHDADSAPAAVAMAAAHPGPLGLLLAGLGVPGVGGPGLVKRMRMDQPGLRALYLRTEIPIEGAPELPAELDGIAIIPAAAAPEALLEAVRAAIDDAPSN